MNGGRDFCLEIGCGVVVADAPKSPTGDTSSRRDPVPTSACSVLENEIYIYIFFINFA